MPSRRSAAAYKITGDDRYATKSAELLRVFFLDSRNADEPELAICPGGPRQFARPELGNH